MSEEILESSGATESAPTSEPVTTTSDSPSQNGAVDSNGQPVEIDSLDRYRYQGRPLKDWESGYMRQQDYTQKTQAIAQERRFFDNLAYDLDAVKKNPSLAEQFKEIYPEKFHAYLRYIENSASPQQTQTQAQRQEQYAKLDPSYEARINAIEKQFRDKEVAAISAELDNKFKTLSEKYSFADEEAVVSRAQTLLAEMKKQDPTNRDLRITDKQWDALWKSSHDKQYAKAKALYDKQVKSQIEANKKGSTAGAGGGIPGQAPRQFKTIKEASDALHKDLEAGVV